MTTQIQKTGIDIIGDIVAWGPHFCLFYETKDDLLDTLVSYCKAGLERDEYCVWVVGEPLTIEEAIDSLKDSVPDLDRYLADTRLELISAPDWYFRGGTFDGEQVTAAWYEKLARASAKGYAGVRVTGDTAWLLGKECTHFCEFKDWNRFCAHEEDLNEVFVSERLAALCTYPLAACGASEILDVVRTHQFALARRHGSWDVIESAGLKRAKAELKLLNEELERRVAERTNQLAQASEALRRAQAEIARINRLTTMGQLAASISHEVMQPVAAGVTNAQAALRWLGARPPDLEEARQAVNRVVRENNRASEVMSRIRALIKKAPPQMSRVDINATILEVIAVTHGETVRNGVSVETHLADGLPLVLGDRVQLQQVILNLIVNAVEAMSGSGQTPRELRIDSQTDASGGALIAVRDSGPGLSPESLGFLFDAFYTTKPDGMGMGLSICRSIVEAHGGRIWASGADSPGATVQFSLPAA